MSSRAHRHSTPWYTLFTAIIFTLLLLSNGCDTSGESVDNKAPKTPQTVDKTSASQPDTPEAPVTEAPAFSYQKATVISTGHGPEICLDFTQALDGSGDTLYQDYLLSDKNLTVSRVQAQRMCLTGGKPGDTVFLTLRAGLPAHSGDTLPEDFELNISLENQDPSVSFTRGFILPLDVAKGLPVTTVNLDTCWLGVLRLPPSAISRIYTGFFANRQFSDTLVAQVNDLLGNLIWLGSMDVVSEPNKPVTTLLNLREMATKGKPGLYFVIGSTSPMESTAGILESSNLPNKLAGQLVLETDLSLTSYHGANGMTVTVRSYATAQPVTGATLTLVSRNLEELGTITTDSQGVAKFPAGLLRGRGASTPTLLTATHGNDVAILDLRATPLDLSDRDITGREPIQGMDAYLYTDRGVYRPREVVNLMAMLRDAKGNAVSDAPLTITINRPDGKTYLRTLVHPKQGGAIHIPLQLPKTAMRGIWHASAQVDPHAPPVGKRSFQVEDFVPERLSIALHTAPNRITPDAEATITLQADFLYGAPGNELGTEATVNMAPDPAPFGGAYSDYTFTMEQPNLVYTVPDMPSTDANGAATFPLALKTLRETAGAERLFQYPVRAQTVVRVREPGGRVSSQAVHIPVLAQQNYLGLRPLFHDGYAPVAQPTKFDLIAVDAAGQRIAFTEAKVSWKRIKTSWQWSRTNGSWGYERVERIADTQTQTVSIAVDSPARVEQMLDWGKYLLEVTHPQTGTTISQPFYVGWGDPTDDRPDRLDVRLDKATYQAGDTATLHINSPVAGEAFVVIANEEVLATLPVSVPAGGKTVSIPVSKDWKPGAYALVSLYQPLTSRQEHTPARAVGLAWIGLDMAKQTLQVSLDSPSEVRPRTTITVPIHVRGASSAHVTLAAVDEGILQLTNFASPSPAGHFFARRRLGTSIQDYYDKLIEATGPMGAIRQGGDISGASGSLAAVPLRILSLFSGVVPVDSSGKAEIPLELPEFQGRLRLMAVAWDHSSVGAASTPMTVRDPLVADIILPRFLAPQDTAEGTMLLQNMDAPQGLYKVFLHTEGMLKVTHPPLKAELAPGKRVLLPITLQATGAGTGTITATITGPAFKASITRQMAIRPGFGTVYAQTSTPLDPKANLIFDADLLQKALAAANLPQNIAIGAVDASIQVGGIPGVDVPALLRWLDRYPYGCLEQTTSRAMPLLYLNEVAAQMGFKQQNAMEHRIRDAVDRIGDMQNNDGSLNMWPGRWRADPWVTVFAMDFLVRAQLQGHRVPETMLEGVKTYLSALVRSNAHNAPAEAVAYAHKVLAQAGVLLTADMRYFHDSDPALSTTGWANIGRALDLVGDKDRAQHSYGQALALLGSNHESPPAPYAWGDRDLALVVANAAESGRMELAREMMQRGGEFSSANSSRTTTQEAAWKLLAVHGLLKGTGEPSATLDGKPLPVRNGMLMVTLPHITQAAEQSILPRELVNLGMDAVWATVSFDITSAQPLPAQTHERLSLKREYLTLDGAPLDLATLQRNDRFMVRLTLQSAEPVHSHRQILVADMLPAGVEAEGFITHTPPAEEQPPIRQQMDDRVMLVHRFETLPCHFVHKDPQPLVTSYIARAVTPGTFTLPPAEAADMYDPTFAVRTTSGMLTIAP